MTMLFNFDEARGLIVERARQLVNCLIEQRGHDRPPFLPEDFARLQGIKKIVKADLGEVSAVLLRFEDGCVIKLNEKHHLVRQAFSCAHEIGHILFSELKLERYVQSIEYRTFNPQGQAQARERARERLCDVAATELLMPESVFQKYLSSFGLSIYSIERLANIFRVSSQAAAIRIAEVSTEPCIALLWQPLRRNDSRELRLKWCISKSPKSQAKGHDMPLHTLVRYPSVLHKAYKYNDSVKCYKLFKLGSIIKRLPMESKGFGLGETRYVISLAFPNK